MAKLFFLSLLSAVVLVSASQAAVLNPDSNLNSVVSEPSKDHWDHLTLDDDNVVDFLDEDAADEITDDNMIDMELTDEEKEVGEPTEFPVKELDEEELTLYMNLEDQIFLAEADEHVAFKLLKEKRSLYTKGGDRLRRKRIAPIVARVAFSVARGLASRFALSGVTRSGSRVTRHYNGRGTFKDAVRDFNRMRPDNVRTFNGRISGRTGTVGKHRVTVRDGSSGNSRPTLEVRSHGGDMVRKFRYNGN